MNEKQYACLKCGFVHVRKPQLIRVDQKATSANRGICGIKAFHGFKTIDECPECLEVYVLNYVEDE